MNTEVTVLMSIYNGERFLKEAIDSILNQTFTDFEFLIINDGSTDTSKEIILSYKDERIRYIENKTNIGLTKSLNIGLKIAKGKYIARMDADDICFSERLEKQFNFMEKNSDIGICGSYVEMLNEKINIKCLWKVPLNHDEIKVRFFFDNMIFHSTAFIRRKILINNNLKYDPFYVRSQDYDLWERALPYTKLANIGKTLIIHRIHNDNIESIYKNEQQEFANKIRLRQLSKIGIYPNNKEKELHKKLLKYQFKRNKDFIINLEKWMMKLLNANGKEKYFDEKYFSKLLYKRWFFLCNLSTVLGFWIFHKYKSSKLSRKKELKYFNELKFLLKCIFKWNYQ